MELPKPPEEPEVKNIIDKLANFVARNGIAFEKMTKEKQKNNPKFSFLFGGDHYNYYQYKLTTEQQILNNQQSNINPQQQAQEAIVQQSIQNAPWQQPQGGFGGFPQAPRPPMQQGMPPRHMQPIPPWQQQQQRHQAPWQQPHPRMGGPPGMPPLRQMLPPSHGPMGPGSDLDQVDLTKQESDLKQEEKEVEAKIKESEDNLRRQHELLLSQEKEQTETAIQNEQDKYRKMLASNNHVSLEDFDDVLQPIISSCTKDSIANGKSWILTNSTDYNKCQVIAQQLLYRISEAKSQMKKQPGEEKKLFDTQLHLIYLINDVLHHASRKNITTLSSAIESVIVPVFSISHCCANDQNQKRLEKLLGLWNKFRYFNTDTMDKLSDPGKALNDYQNEIEKKHSQVIEETKRSIQTQYEQFQKQHEEYAHHIKDEVAKKRTELEKKKMQPQHSTPSSQDSGHGSRDRMEAEDDQDYNNPSFSGPNRRSNEGDNPPWSDRYEEGEGDGFYDNFNQGPRPRGPNFDRRLPNQGMNFRPRHPPPDWRNNDQVGERPDWEQDDRESGNWRRDGPGPDRFDDRNQNWGNRRAPPPPRPPGPGPRSMGVVQDDSALIPKVPYYDLPAGLMAPLVNLEDMDYKELDPSLIRLPPPVPPSDRLLAAVEAFYAPPSHERPRNPEGWEHNGLFEFFRAKVRAKRRVDQGKSRFSRSRSRERRSYSRDRSYSRSRSRSRSRSSSDSRSRSSRSRSRSNSRSPGPGHRPTPPSFGPAYYQNNVNPDGRLGDQNRGAQMMMKMGWGGAGLGSSEQGIQDPVKAGDVRDKYDQFKGLGMDLNDPYETFRKTRSYGYGPRARGRGGN